MIETLLAFLILLSPFLAFCALLGLLGSGIYDENGELVGHHEGLIERIWRRCE
jgi:hypothetical protein